MSNRWFVTTVFMSPLLLQCLSRALPVMNMDDCVCVPYYQCNDKEIITNGKGVIDIRLRSCKNYLDFCCRPADRVDKPITKKPSPTKQIECGIRHLDGVGFRILGDLNNESQFGEFPWMVAILTEEIVNEFNLFKCGGALIHPQVVLTAAHCVASNRKDKHKLKIRAGEWDTQTNKELLPHQDRKVDTVVIHEKYYSGALHNDFALLLLTEPVILSDNVDTICLPEADAVFDNQRCFASGWGKNVFGKEGNYQIILKKIELPIISREPCVQALRKTRLGQYFELDESFICAGGEPGKDTCKGDGGSPLVCPLANDPSRYVQAGIVAWGIGCGDNTPGVYANVALARNWIDEQIALYNFNTNSYKYLRI